jgi:hypothetical protein
MWGCEFNGICLKLLRPQRIQGATHTKREEHAAVVQHKSVKTRQQAKPLGLQRLSQGQVTNQVSWLVLSGMPHEGLNTVLRSWAAHNLAQRRHRSQKSGFPFGVPDTDGRGHPPDSAGFH